VVLLACAAQAVIGADGLAVAISLPALQDDLDVRAIDGQWVLSAYALAFGGSLLLGGRLGDLYGHRRVLAWGMALFAGGSLVAALAPGLGAVIAARAAQGSAPRPRSPPRWRSSAPSSHRGGSARGRWRGWRRWPAWAW